MEEDAQETIYQTILKQSHTETFKREEESRRWFRQKATEVSKNKTVPTKIILEKEHVPAIKNIKQVGSLFLYNYAPKHKKTLDYYDTFPIVFPFKMVTQGFYGLNLHYLPTPYRAIFMDNMYSLLNSKDMEQNTTRLAKMTYSVLESRRNLRFFQPCIHMYLHKNIRSKIAFIPPKEWELALFLPLQRFQKKSENVIWKESKAIIKQGTK
jgi:hypothetical protein